MKLFLGVFMVIFSIGSILFAFAWVDQEERREAKIAHQVELAAKLALVEQRKEEEEEEESKESTSAFVKAYTPNKSIESYEPSIGMTVEEVQNSSWGFPNDIRSTTTAYSVTQMWIYPEGNYIHFEDGLVSSVVRDF